MSSNLNNHVFSEIFIESLKELPSEEQESHLSQIQELLEPPVPPPKSPSPVPTITTSSFPSWRKCTFCSQEATVICSKCRHQFCEGCKYHRDIQTCSYGNCENPCMDGDTRCSYHGYRGVSYGRNGNINYDGR